MVKEVLKVEDFPAQRLQNSTDLFTEEEIAILAEIEVSHVYLYQSQSFVAKRGKAEIITDYLTRLTDHTNEAYPYKITVSDRKAPYYDCTVWGLLVRSI